MKRALITGITGQTGSYLAEHLLDLGYQVHGLVRRVALAEDGRRLARIEHIRDRLVLYPGDVTSYGSVYRVVVMSQPDECYHLAAQSFVTESFEDPHATMLTNVQGTLHVLDALRSRTPECKLYFAATSEMFGDSPPPQCEETPLRPRSPYAVSKVAGFHLVRNYREAYGMHASSGILMNHESPRRGPEFVTRKITLGVAAIQAGWQDKIKLGNLDACRDWGFAGDYVKAMHLMLQQPAPDDYVVATGQTHSVREFCKVAFDVVGRDYRDHVEVDEKFMRPTEVYELRGDAAKARCVLNWEPQVGFEQLVREMVQADLRGIAGRAA